MRTAGTCAEKREQRIDVAVLGVHHDLVEAEPTEEFPALRIVGVHLRGEGGAHRRMRGVDLDDLTRFGILQPCGTDIGEHPLRGIFERHGDDVMALRQPRQRLLEIVGEKVGREEDHRAMGEQAHEAVDRDGHRRAAADRRGGHEIANEAQRVLASLACRECVLHAIGEHQQADAIVVARGRQRQHASHLDREFMLEVRAGTETRRPRHVDHEHDRELALLDVALDERTAHAGRHIPVDRADLIAGLIFADFGELHPLPLEERAILTGEARIDQPPRAHFNAAHLPEHLGRCHRQR